MSKQKDSRFQTIVNTSTDTIIVVDRDGIVQYVNPAAEGLFDRLTSELLGTLFGFPLVAGEITELDIIRKNGGFAAAEMRVVELEWEGHSAYLAILRDITSRKRTQDELQSLYNAVTYLFKGDSLSSLGRRIASAVVEELKHVDCGVFLIDPQQEQIIRLARAGEYKIEAKQLFPEGPGLVPESIRTGKVVYVPDVNTDPLYVTGHNLTKSELVIPLKTVNGILGALDLQSTQFNAFDEAQQRVLTAFAERAAAAIENMQLYEAVNLYSNELESRVAARTADLARSKDRVEAILTNASDAIILADPDGTVQQTNPAFFRLFGWTIIEIVGTSLFQFFHEDRLALEEALLRTTQNKISTHVEVSGQRRGNTQFVAEMALAPIVETNGVISSIVCILRDVSEHHQLEKELRLSLEHEKELSELKSRFVSIASHEFRTPLAAILSSTESVIAYRDRLTDVQIDHKLTTITQQVKHLTNIIEDVLNLGRIQAGRIDFRPVDLDLNVLCQDVLRELQANRDNMPRIQYNCNFSHVMMYLDETLIRQAFTNLVSNAIKYSAPDKAIIINLEKTDNLLVLRVQDQGIGIPDADIKHLFEPFHRATNVGTIPGTGLGLSITQEAVEMHGGTISVDSKISVGTTITVNIPLRNRGGARHDENSGNRR